MSVVADHPSVSTMMGTSKEIQLRLGQLQADLDYFAENFHKP